MLRLYNIVLLPLRAVSALCAWSVRDPRRASEWAERRARSLPAVSAGGLWIHGASVGEVRIVRELARSIREQRPVLPLVISSTTRAGRALLPGPPLVDAAFFMPLDFPGTPARVLDAVRPAALVLVETELWPNLLHEASERRVPVVVVNGRLSPRRMSRYRRLLGLYRPLLEGLAKIGVQTEQEAQRFVELGARPQAITVTGNVKYDLPHPVSDASSLRLRFGLTRERPVLVAGSTGPGEEALVIDAFVAARREHPDLFLILAPRHPERGDEVEREAGSRGVRLHRLSSVDPGSAGGGDGLLVDTLGELASLYGVGSVAFVGGSLVPVGGHNVLEPAAAAVPVVFGPHTDHVAGPAETLLRAGGGYRVRDAADLTRVVRELLADPSRRRRMTEAAAGVVRANAGALERSVDLVLSVVDGALRTASVRPA